MLTSIHIRHFQSLHDVELPLDKFTVIVGPSSSGKSAFVRAFKALAYNVRGLTVLEHGENAMQVALDMGERGQVILTRGKSAANNSYVVDPPRMPTRGRSSESQTFTKLGGSVPPEVSRALGIAPQDALQFAGQFDRPYLLDAPASEVARVLGSLTNVTVIFEAAREANRQKLAAASTLRTRESDLDDIRTRAEGFRSLKAQKQALTEAQEHLSVAKKISTEITRLKDLADTLDTEETSVKWLSGMVGIVVPDLERIEKAQERLQRFEKVLAEFRDARDDLRAAQAVRGEMESLVERLEAEYVEVLHEAGTCPTCGSDTSHVHEMAGV